MSNAHTKHETKDTETNAKAVKDAAKGDTAPGALSAAADTKGPLSGEGATNATEVRADPPKKAKLSIEDRVQRLEDLFRAMGHQLD